MVRQRAVAAGIHAPTGYHMFRATGIPQKTDGGSARNERNVSLTVRFCKVSLQ
jgi:hypothetical protein